MEIKIGHSFRPDDTNIKVKCTKQISNWVKWKANIKIVYPCNKKFILCNTDNGTKLKEISWAYFIKVVFKLKNYQFPFMYFSIFKLFFDLLWIWKEKVKTIHPFWQFQQRGLCKKYLCICRQITRIEAMKYARAAYDMGIRYIGGCCGFEPYHIRQSHSK